MRYFEDLEVGQETTGDGEYLVTEDEIIEMGQRFDPQPWHTDLEAAKETIFGGLVASSAHIFSIWSALGNAVMDQDKLIGGSVSALGFNHLQWHKPAKPNDVLRRSQVVTALRDSLSKPGLGIITIRETVFNQNKETVFTLECTFLVKKKSG